jgi:hypothetical protein
VPLLGIVAALMIVGMSAEIVPIAYHVNLSVIGGILLGPALSAIAAFIVVIVLAMLGHGGVTVIGLNALSSLPKWCSDGHSSTRGAGARTTASRRGRRACDRADARHHDHARGRHRVACGRR